jgi:hypothetical protein
MVAMKVNTGNEPRERTKEIDDRKLRLMTDRADEDCSPAPGNLDTNWQQIGFLVTRVLSSAVQARKEREEANAAASSLSFYSPPGGEQGGKMDCNGNDQETAYTAKEPEANVIRLDVRARIRRTGSILDGHANENFRTEKQIK